MADADAGWVLHEEDGLGGQAVHDARRQQDGPLLVSGTEYEGSPGDRDVYHWYNGVVVRLTTTDLGDHPCRPPSQARRDPRGRSQPVVSHVSTY